MSSQEKIQQALQYAKEGNASQAEKMIKDILTDNPNDEIAWLALAHISRKYDDKIKYLRQVLSINPDNSVAKQKLDKWQQKNTNRQSAPTSRFGMIAIVTAALLFVISVGILFGWITYTYSFSTVKANNSSWQTPSINEQSLTPTEMALLIATEIYTIEPTQQATPSPSNTFTPTQLPSQTPSPTDTISPTLTGPPTNTATETITPSSTPSFTPSLPPTVQITAIQGKPQVYPLSCESNAATTWAAFLGHKIRELDFFNRLPSSDNPEEGFVGDVHGEWGQIPPNSYGVYAGPVAQLLRDYGVNAMAVRNMSWEDLQRELAAGRPAIVWVVGKVERGTSLNYVAADGKTTIVARYQHTVNIIGYSDDKVTILDGGNIYHRPTDTFLQSWSVLGNMTIIQGP